MLNIIKRWRPFSDRDKLARHPERTVLREDPLGPSDEDKGQEDRTNDNWVSVDETPEETQEYIRRLSASIDDQVLTRTSSALSFTKSVRSLGERFRSSSLSLPTYIRPSKQARPAADDTSSSHDIWSSTIGTGDQEILQDFTRSSITTEAFESPFSNPSGSNAASPVSSIGVHPPVLPPLPVSLGSALEMDMGSVVAKSDRPASSVFRPGPSRAQASSIERPITPVFDVYKCYDRYLAAQSPAVPVHAAPKSSTPMPTISSISTPTRPQKTKQTNQVDCFDQWSQDLNEIQTSTPRQSSILSSLASPTSSCSGAFDLEDTIHGSLPLEPKVLENPSVQGDQGRSRKFTVYRDDVFFDQDTQGSAVGTTDRIGAWRTRTVPPDLSTITDHST